MREPLEGLMAERAAPAAAERLFGQMMRDIMGAGADPIQEVRFLLCLRGRRAPAWPVWKRVLPSRLLSGSHSPGIGVISAAP